MRGPVKTSVTDPTMPRYLGFPVPRDWAESVPMADEQRHIPISKGHELVSHLARCFYSQIWTTDFRSLILQMIIIIRPSTPTNTARRHILRAGYTPPAQYLPRISFLH